MDEIGDRRVERPRRGLTRIAVGGAATALAAATLLLAACGGNGGSPPPPPLNPNSVNLPAAGSSPAAASSTGSSSSSSASSGSSSASSAPSGSGGSTAAPAPSGPATVAAGKTKLGDVLVDAKGITLYRYTADSKDKSNCSGPCAQVWPILPPPSSGQPVAGPGVTQSDLGVISRSDGKKQVTYDGWPLYTYLPDTKPGDVTGQKVKDPGGVWYVVYPQVSKNPAPPASK